MVTGIVVWVVTGGVRVQGDATRFLVFVLRNGRSKVRIVCGGRAV